MKRLIQPVFIILLLILAPTMRSQAQITEIIRAIIVAADIAVQKVQNATLQLQNVQKEVENELSKLKLAEIGNWEGKIKDLYSDYFDELYKVKTAIAYFKGITGVIAQQSQLVSEYKAAYGLIRQDKNFSAAELAYMYKVYTGIITESAKSLDEIVTLLTSFTLQMTDAARLKIIQQASSDIQRQTADLRSLNNQAIQISLQRAHNLDDITAIRKLYGLSN